MKKNKFIICTVFLLLLSSCAEKKEFGEPMVDVNTTTADFQSWWKYYNYKIVLSSDFVPINELGEEINKEEFLKTLTSGNFVPIELKSNTDKTYYKLFKLGDSSEKGINPIIKNEAIVNYAHFKQEGQKFPTFNFTDINGVDYTSENTKGKIVVLKCWFIHCKACVAEFPELNKLVKLYKDNDDIVFISLALDTKEQLEKFLEKKPFNYSVISEQRDFMSNKMGVSIYPTHFIINKEGNIEKVVNSSVELITALGQHGLLKNFEHKDIPLSELPMTPPPSPTKRPPPPPQM